MLKIKKDLKELKNNLKLSWFFVRDQKKYLIIIMLISIIMSVVSFVLPLFSAQLLIKLTNGIVLDLLFVVFIIFFIEITRNILSFFFSRLFEFYSIKATTNAQMKMFEETLKIETKVIEEKTTGTFIERINNDTADIINIFSDLSGNIISLVSNLGILFAIFIINKYMFILFVVNIIVINKIEYLSRDIFHEKQKKLRLVCENRTGLISEVVRGLKDVKLLNASNGVLTSAKKKLEEVNTERINMTKLTSKFYLISGSMRDFFDVLFYVLGSILVCLNNLSITNFVILYTYKDKVDNLIFYYNRIASLIKNFNLSAMRVFEVIGNEFSKEQDNGSNIKSLKGNIEFKNVTFAYDSENVLNNINLNINKGERVGFVGTSGSGKSTLFNLLTKLYPLEHGQILIDGKNINQISNISLRKNISLIPQNPYIFNFSVKENLKLGNLKATKKELIEACKKAEIYAVINNLEKRFNTFLGEGGVMLSGGEKQRLAIARTLIKKSNIILFDESTSALDNVTQDKIQKAIYGMDRDKTILIIAHRLSTIKKCDKIVVVDEGKIIDIGAHEELYNRCKKYKQLYDCEINE